MTTYPIDKDIPLPPRVKKSRRKGTSKGTSATLRLLEKGDSFAITTLTESTRTGMYNVARKLGIEIFVSRAHQRVWRVK